MNTDSAIKLIKETFNNKFTLEQYRKFIINLLDGINEEASFKYNGIYVPELFRNHVSSYGRVGKYTDKNEELIDVLYVHLKKETALDRARTMQRNFISYYLNVKKRKAALVAFYNEELDDWRFSYVKMDYNLVQKESGKIGTEKEFTPAKRYSFLVEVEEGKNKNHTAQKRLLPLLERDKPEIDEIEDAFNIEKVSKEFFALYKELFHELVDDLKKVREDDLKKGGRINNEFVTKQVTEENFCKKLMGQIVFLYFLQKKGWLGVHRHKDWGTGNKNFLRELFEDAEKNKGNYFNDYLEYLFYEALNNGERDDDFYGKFNCKIPFLNGGLFEPIGNIGGYDWISTDIVIPNEVFSNKKKTKEGDIGTGILDAFDRYNFTVKEDEPLEKEVAVDPEMLGKVFEELLDVVDRKSKGAFYTPREIVHYMCQESLINYLYTAVNTKEEVFQEIVSKEAIADFIHYGDIVAQNEVVARAKEKAGTKTTKYEYELHPSIRENAKSIDEKLESIRICDPAIGSGAFPVGMMNEIIRARMTLVEAGYLNGAKKRTPYEYKRQAIQNCIYGVDIDSGAIEIAKLRLWLSLVVDEDDIKSIKLLPNLDYKIVCGNSLLGVERTVFNDYLINKLEHLKPEYFNENRKREKKALKKEIDELIKQIAKDGTFDFQLHFSEVFHEKGGFDVVIGNPPYISAVQHAKENAKEREIYRKKYPLVKGAFDLYVIFLIIGISISNKKASYSWIIPNKFLVSDYAFDALNHLKLNGLNKTIDVSKYNVFKNAGVYPIILIGDKPNCSYKEYYIESLDDLSINKIKEKNQLKTYKTFRDFSVKIGSGMTGFQAKSVIEDISESESNNSFPFIVSGSIDKYTINFKNIRYMGNKYKKAFITKGKSIADSKWNFWKNEKIIIAGMTKEIEATFSKTPLAIGVGAYAIYDYAGFSPLYLLGLLNSSYLTWYLNVKFEDKHLAGGYLAINKSTIEQLPLVKANKLVENKVSLLVNDILEFTNSDDYFENQQAQIQVKRYQDEIDLIVYKLYELDYNEVLIVDPGFKMSEEEYNSYSLPVGEGSSQRLEI